VPLKVLITGGSGFIGRNLIELLGGLYEISAPPHSELDLLDDALIRDYLTSNRFDIVLHAATGRSNRKFTAPDLFKNSCRMFFNLTRNRHLFGKMLHFGSGAEFGVRVPRMSEQLFDTYIPGDDYAFAKYIAAQFIESAQSNIYNLRLFAVFGKYEAWEVRFISNAICRVLFDLPIVLRQNARFDYLYINDLARLVCWFIEHDTAHKTYNVCRGESHEIVSLAHTVAEVSGQNPGIRVARDGFAPEYSGDNTRMLHEMNGFTFTPIKQSIRELYSWYEAHLSLIDSAALEFDG
jgi:UDP-glucose 4-epimerase